jgi:hypothetical protein
MGTADGRNALALFFDTASAAELTVLLAATRATDRV